MSEEPRSPKQLTFIPETHTGVVIVWAGNPWIRRLAQAIGIVSRPVMSVVNRWRHRARNATKPPNERCT